MYGAMRRPEVTGNFEFVRGGAAALAAALLFLAGSSACRPQGSPSPAASDAAPAAAEDPVLSIGAACSDCHAEIVAAYRAAPMARALDAVAAGEFEGLGAVRESSSGYAYAFESGPDGPDGGSDARGPRVVETRDDGYRRELEVAFAIGAGELDRSYALARDGHLWFAPIEVVSAHGARPRHAALAPFAAMSPGARDSFALTAECLGCHTDRPPPPAWPLNLQPSPEAWTPRGIGCGACHAEAEAHARWQEADLAGEAPAGSDPLMRPLESGETSDTARRLSVCAACHLQGDARIPLDPDQLGPPPPGGDLLAQRAVFVAAEPTSDVGFVSHVERLLLSRCYLESEPLGGLSCETCHDPHHGIDWPGERERTRAACTQCHATHATDEARALACSLPAAQKGERDCASCHMRRTPVFDVAGVEIHDHWIRTDPGPPSTPGPLRFAESPSGDWKRVRWPGEPAPPHVDDPGLHLMALFHGGHLARATALLDGEAGPEARALPMYHHVRGSLLEHDGRLEEAREAYRAALALAPDFGPSATNLGALCGRLGSVNEGLRVLDSLLARHPRAAGALRNRAVLHDARGDRLAARRDLVAAFEALPDALVARTLARLHEALGDADGARRWSAEAARLDPLLEH